MSEIRTIPETILASGIKDTSIDAVGKFSKKVIHHNAGPPTAADDTGLGYAVGSIWVDSTNGDMYACTDSTAEDATWINQEGDDVNPPFVMQGTTYGWLAGGNSCPSGFQGGALNSITRFSFVAPEAGTAVGELAFNRASMGKGSIRSDSLALVIGGYQSHPDAYPGNEPGGAGAKDRMDSFTFAATSTVTDIGEYSGGVKSSTGTTTDGTTGFVFGGEDNSSVKTDVTTKIPMTSPHPQSDNGELSGVRGNPAGLTDLTYAFAVGGQVPPYSDIIEKMAFSTTSGPFSDVGELSRVTHGLGVASGTTKGFVAGGGPPPLQPRHEINTFTFASPFVTADVGELAGTQRAYVNGCSSTDYAYWVGGILDSPPHTATVDTISRIPWSATSGGSTDFGELSNHNPYPGTGAAANAGSYESS